jgi:excisionase family DNA binding protein
MVHDAFPPGRIVFSIKETCHATGMGKTTLYGHIKTGKIPIVRLGGRSFIPISALRALFEVEA